MGYCWVVHFSFALSQACDLTKGLGRACPQDTLDDRKRVA